MRGILLRAIESQLPVEIIYQAKDGTLSQRAIRVIEMKDERMKAYCYLRKKVRVFHLTNILSITPVRSKYRQA